MSQSDLVYCIDAGNSTLKVGRFENQKLIDFQRVNYENWHILKNNIPAKTAFFISTVLNDSQNDKFFGDLKNPKFLSPNSLIPIQMDYKLPESLGTDRICNAVAANFFSKKQNQLVIDIGTCIKFDLVLNKNYKGGSISPGINLRYKTLNDYTGKLPLLDKKKKAAFTGNNTESCIESGVLNGIQGELNHFIEHYTSQLTDLDIYITGGDSEHFDFPIKNNIFANSNLTMEGLHQIYLHNS